MFPASVHGREQRGTAWYRLTRDNQRRPKENADVGVTHITASRWRTDAQGSHCREGGAGHHRPVCRTTERTESRQPVSPEPHWIAKAGWVVNGDARGAGYGSPVRPGLWGDGRSNPPAYPTADFEGARANFTIVLPVRLPSSVKGVARCQGRPSRQVDARR